MIFYFFSSVSSITVLSPNATKPPKTHLLYGNVMPQTSTCKNFTCLGVHDVCPFLETVASDNAGKLICLVRQTVKRSFCSTMKTSIACTGFNYLVHLIVLNQTLRNLKHKAKNWLLRLLHVFRFPVLSFVVRAGRGECLNVLREGENRTQDQRMLFFLTPVFVPPQINNSLVRFTARNQCWL